MEKTSIVFTGDICFDKHMLNKWEDPELLSKSVLDFLGSADHVCANVEGAVVEKFDGHGAATLVHSMDSKVVDVLCKMKADIWSIGNNHIMDAGEKGLVSTLNLAKKQNANVLGAGINLDEASKPIFLDGSGGIGLIGVSYMTGCVPATENSAGILRWDDWDTIQKRIDQIKEKCHWCVIVAHGGEEFSSLPLPYTRNRYHKYLQMGADVVMGHHPHVPENYEILENGKMIFYSLGNFIFDTNYQREHLYTDSGVLVKLIFTNEKVDFEAMGIKISRDTERITEAPLPPIFVNIGDEEYELLAPLSAKAFIEEDKRIMRFLEPERFVGCSDEYWEQYYTEVSAYYSKDAHMDYDVIIPLMKQAETNKWKQSKLNNVKEYILRQL